MQTRLARAVPVLFVLLLATDAVAQTRRPPTVDDLLDLVQVSSPQISPDGKKVLYTRSD